MSTDIKMADTFLLALIGEGLPIFVAQTLLSVRCSAVPPK